MNTFFVNGSLQQLQATLNKYRQSSIEVRPARHGCIIAVSMGLKVIAVSGDWIIDAFMKAAGLHPWVLNETETHLLKTMLQKVTKQPAATAGVHQIQYRNKQVAPSIQRLCNSTAHPQTTP